MRPIMIFLFIFLAGSCGRIIDTEEFRVQKDGNSVPYALPRGMISVRASWDGQADSLVKLRMGKVLYYPDKDARYFATFKPSAISNDSFVIRTEFGGLLTTVNVAAEDRTPDIIAKIGEIAATVVSPLPPVPAAAAATYSQPQFLALTKKFSVEARFDPFDTDSLAAARSVLNSAGVSLSVNCLEPGDGGLGGPCDTDPGFLATDLIFDEEKGETCGNSICFRLLTPVIIELSYTSPLAGQYGAQFLALVPDPRRQVGFDLTRAACVEKVSQLSFDRGILTRASVDKPSEILGCLEIPLEVAKAIVSVAGSLLTVRTVSDPALIEAQAEVLDTQQEVLETQAVLVETQQGIIEEYLEDQKR